MDPLTGIIRWGENHPLVRAMILTSTRAVPEGRVLGTEVDDLSDYDVILIVTDVHPFQANREWLSAFGAVLAMYQDPLELEEGLPRFGNVVQFEDGLKIDFTFWPVDLLRRIAEKPDLPEELDAGYRVLLDKDGLTVALKPPGYRSYIPSLPTAERYRYEIESFYLTSIYVAKYLWRDDLIAAKYVLDMYMKQEHMRPMLEWLIEIDHGGMVKPGIYMRGIKKWLRPELYAALESTFTGPGMEENWQALDRTIDLMRAAALEVGAHLGFDYPQEMENGTRDRIQAIKTRGK